MVPPGKSSQAAPPPRLSRFYGSTEGLPLTKVFIVVQLRCPKSTNLENSNCTSHHQPNSAESRSSSLSLSLDNYQLKVFFELFPNRRKNFLLWLSLFFWSIWKQKLKPCRKNFKNVKVQIGILSMAFPFFL